jgi:pimeloyl-ACP methyl ester carboxylesterase
MRARTVNVGGSVHYADFGGSGPAMVLVHGLGGSHANWLAVGDGLAKRARVVAPDLAGFGRTRPQDHSSSRIAENRALLDRFIEAVIGGPAILVGNSMGGFISLAEAAASPQKVAGLVLAAPAQPAPRGTKIDPHVRLVFTLYAIPGVAGWYLRRRTARLGAEGLVAEVLRLCCVDPTRVPPDIVAAHVALARERLESMPWANDALLVAARSLMAELRHRDRFETLVASVKQPTLLIQGTEDRLVSLAASQALARLHPEWTFEMFEDTGHVPQLEAPKRFVDSVTRWLDGPGAGAAAAAKVLP